MWPGSTPVFRVLPGRLFHATTPSCATTTDGKCFTSPGWPSNYGNSESCTIVVSADVSLVVQSFATESDYDVLTVNGRRRRRYSGSGTCGWFCPRLDGLMVHAGDVITWSSDESTIDAGFKICSAGTQNLPTSHVRKVQQTASSGIRSPLRLVSRDFFRSKACALSLWETWVGILQTLHLPLPRLLQSLPVLHLRHV
jgi:hypothetical protein